MNKILQNPFTIILFFFCLLFLYTKLAEPIPLTINSIQTTKSNLFSVSGVGEATGIPNTAQISLGITKSAITVIDAQNQANSAMNKTIDDLKKLGIEKKNIKTTNYSVNPDYEFLGGKQTIKGYTVTQSLEVRVEPIEKANSAIDLATSNGLNLIGGVTFVLDDPTREKLENEARIKAVEEAKKKAESLAKASGIKLGRIIDVQESLGGFPRIQPLTLDAQKVGSTVSTELSPGENKVSLSITLSYETN